MSPGTDSTSRPMMALDIDHLQVQAKPFDLDVLENGSVLFNDNVVCLSLGPEEPMVGISAIIGTRGDVCVHDNQFECRYAKLREGVNVSVIGETVRVADNRFKESRGVHNTPGRVRWSAFTFAWLMNCTTGNQSTHCLSIECSSGRCIRSPNLTLALNCPQFREIIGIVSGPGPEKEPLPGITVSVKQTGAATVTGTDGGFRLRAPDTEVVLIAVAPGLARKEIPVPAEQDSIDITIG